MKKPYELWGQVGATFYLTDTEMGQLLRFDQESANLFFDLVQERRYEIDDQFYAPEFDAGKDIFINLHDTDRTDAVWPNRNDRELYPRKIWCRMGVVFSVDDSQMEVLRKGDRASAELVFSLTDTGRYSTEGSCLFGSGNEIKGYDEPEQQCYIDLYQDGTQPSVTGMDKGISFN